MTLEVLWRPLLLAHKASLGTPAVLSTAPVTRLSDRSPDHPSEVSPDSTGPDMSLSLCCLQLAGPFCIYPELGKNNPFTTKHTPGPAPDHTPPGHPLPLSLMEGRGEMELCPVSLWGQKPGRKK